MKNAIAQNKTLLAGLLVGAAILVPICMGISKVLAEIEKANLAL